MHRHVIKEKSGIYIDSVEASAPILTNLNNLNLQAPTNVESYEKDGLTKTLAPQGRRRKETGTGCLNNLKPLISREFPIPVGNSQTAKPGAKSTKRKRCLKKDSKAYTQLTLWDTERDPPFG